MFSRLLFFESEYHDEESTKRKKENLSKDNIDKVKQQSSSSSSSQKRKMKKKKSENEKEKENSDVPLLDLDNESLKDSFQEQSQVTNHEEQHINNEKNSSMNYPIYILLKIKFIIYFSCCYSNIRIISLL